MRSEAVPGPGGSADAAGPCAVNTSWCRRLRGWALCLLVAPSVAAAAGNAPGSYCPFPEEGKKPECLTGAQARYSGFYRGIESGRIDADDAARVEEDLVAGGEAARTYQALSSIAYAYYVLARRAAESPRADPELVARLERWNALLALAYHDTPSDASLRAAVREAAEDLRRRAAPVELACKDADGDPARCTSTDAVLRSIDDARDQTGVRGQLGRLMEHLLGGEPR